MPTPNIDPNISGSNLEHMEIMMEKGGGGQDDQHSKLPSPSPSHSSTNSSSFSDSNSQMASPTSDQRDKVIQDHNITELLEKIRTDGKDLLTVIRSLIAFTMLAFIPVMATFLYITNAEYYDITKEKLFSEKCNAHMEFVRWGTVIIICFDAYFLIFHIITNCYSLFHYSMKFFNMGRPSRRLKRFLSYIVICRHWITLFIWTGFIMFIGSTMVYRSSYSESFMQSVNSSSAAASTATTNKPPTIEAIHNAQYMLEKLFVVILVAFISIAVGRFSTEMLKIGYLKVAFESRVHKNNWAFESLMKLKTILSMDHVPGECKVVMEVISTNRDIRLKNGRDSFMETENGTREMARRTFNQMLPPGVTNITLGDVERYFYQRDLKGLRETVFLDEHDNEIELPLTQQQWIDCILQVFFKRQELMHGLKNATEIISTYDTLMFCLSCLVTWCLGVPSLGLGSNAIFVIIGILWAALGFLFQNAVKNIFEALIFVFIEHCFDVGDRVIIDNEYLTVFKIELFTTVFRRGDGTAIYMPNSVLANKPVINIRRSGPQSENFSKSYKGTITVNDVQGLLEDLQRFTASNPKDYTGKVDLLDYSGNSEQVDIKFLVEYASNFQNSSLQSKRSIMIEDFFEEASAKREMELVVADVDSPE